MTAAAAAPVRLIAIPAREKTRSLLTRKGSSFAGTFGDLFSDLRGR
jgi:hypothetical protein